MNTACYLNISCGLSACRSFLMMASPIFRRDNSVLFLAPAPNSRDDVLYKADLSAPTAEEGKYPLRQVAQLVEGGNAEATLSLDEKLRRERLRQYSTGITGFTLVNQNVVLYNQHGSLYASIIPEGDAPLPTPFIVIDKAAVAAMTGGDPEAPILDARPSPAGNWIAFVHDSELHVATLRLSPDATEPFRCFQVTSGARGNAHLKNGLPEYIAEEELDRHEGYWWSPCGNFIVYQRTDESSVEEFTIRANIPESPLRIDAGAGLQEVLDGAALKPYSETWRYPFSGRSNAKVTFHFLDVSDLLKADAGTAVEVCSNVPLNFGEGEMYFLRLAWLEDVRVPSFLVAVSNRMQDVFDLVLVSAAKRPDAAGLEVTLLIRETAQSGWLNCPPKLFYQLPRSISKSAAIPLLWSSEVSGFRHLYLFSINTEASAPHLYCGPNAEHMSVSPLEDLRPFAHYGSICVNTGLMCFSHMITSGSFMVTDILGVYRAELGADLPLVFFQAIGSDSTTPMESHVCCVPLSYHDWSILQGPEYSWIGTSTPIYPGKYQVANGTIEGSIAARMALFRTSGVLRITEGAGWHKATFAENCKFFVDELSCIYAKEPSIAFYEVDLRHLAQAYSPGVSAALGAPKSAEDHHSLLRGEHAPVDGALRDRCCASLEQLFGLSGLTAPVDDGRSMLISAIVPFTESGHFVLETSANPYIRILGLASGSVPPPEAASVVFNRHCALVAARESGRLGEVVEKLRVEQTFPFSTIQGALQHLLSGEAAGAAPRAADCGSLKHLKKASECVDPALLDAFNIPIILKLRTADSAFDMYASLSVPFEAETSGPYPTVVHVYGGPHAQMVRNACDVRSSLRGGRSVFMKQGCAVVTFDNRGSFNRGAAFERALYKRMGTVEVEDQVAGVTWLHRAGVTDLLRVGVHGWSYGGYMTLMCLAQCPEVFRVGVAGAPVTDWSYYDTAYTERYMLTPDKNAEGYANGSVLRFAKDLSHKHFTIIHGNIDENVHFRNSSDLLKALQDAPDGSSNYKLLELPGERHGARNLIVAVRNATVDFLCKHLSLS